MGVLGLGMAPEWVEIAWGGGGGFTVLIGGGEVV